MSIVLLCRVIKTLLLKRKSDFGKILRLNNECLVVFIIFFYLPMIFNICQHNLNNKRVRGVKERLKFICKANYHFLNYSQISRGGGVEKGVEGILNVSKFPCSEGMSGINH